MAHGELGEALGNGRKLLEQLLALTVAGIPGLGVIRRGGQKDMAHPEASGLAEALGVGGMEAAAVLLGGLRHVQLLLQQGGDGGIGVVQRLGGALEQAEGRGPLAQQLAHHQGPGRLELGGAGGIRRVELHLLGDGGLLDGGPADPDGRGAGAPRDHLDIDLLHGDGPLASFTHELVTTGDIAERKAPHVHQAREGEEQDDGQAQEDVQLVDP